MPDILLLLTLGTLLFLLLGLFIALLSFRHEQRRRRHQAEVDRLHAAFQQEILQARLEMQEQTFLSVAQEIHDNVGQLLSLARLHLRPSDEAEHAQLADRADSARLLLDQALEDLRHLSRQLNSHHLRQQPLSELLQLQLALIQKTGTVETRLNLRGEAQQLHPDKKLLLYRITQEALQNSLRHANAAHITVEIAFTPGMLTLTIEDDGQGFLLTQQETGDTVVQGTGLQNIRYRAELIGARCEFNSEQGAGTRLTLSLPLP
ncbi:sensor histidine kinase [Pontibacter qinzhouensis]|nr:ATP-binding protein [Pontibacter qinzhouensis]